ERAQFCPWSKSARTYAWVTKAVEELPLPNQVGPAMRRAFSSLKSGRLGPVMLEVPADVVRADLGTDTIAYAPVRAARSGGDPRDLDEAAKLLIEAKSPLLYAGQGVLYAEAGGGPLAVA